MHRFKSAVSALGLIMLAATGPASAGGLTEAGELHAASLNALAGGPVSARDKELLERYGCLSGTRSAFSAGRKLTGGTGVARAGDGSIPVGVCTLSWFPPLRI
ncbi:MAG: hypothetical protein ACTSX8_08715 [Alphaproteobacteria bacterium]